MAPLGQIIGLRQVISAESQNKYDDKLSRRSGLEEFLFLIGFLLLLMLHKLCILPYGPYDMGHMIWLYINDQMKWPLHSVGSKVLRVRLIVENQLLHACYRQR